jgi:CubicO group peptidase (beta-lactamase class C family)
VKRYVHNAARLIIKWLLAPLLVIFTVALLVVWIADPAVLRNIFFGQPLDEPASIHLSQPQERVVGRAGVELPNATSETLAAERLANAVRLAESRNSVALLVWHQGALRFERYWAPHTADTRTNTNSMHKTVLALAVGAAIEDGYIPSLESKAATWLTEWQDDARREITIERLLRMDSGLALPVFGTWRGIKLLLGSDSSSTVLQLPAERPAGSDFQYSNASSQLLTLIVERATGQRYAKYLSHRLWQRLGAADAALWLDREAGMPRGFCCLFATARDWLRVGLLLEADGRWQGEQLVSAEWVRTMKTPSRLNANFGMNLWLGSPEGTQRKYNDFTLQAYHSAPFVAEDVYFIDGFGGQRMYAVPSRELLVVRTGVSQVDWDDAPLLNELILAVDEGGGVQ